MENSEPKSQFVTVLAWILIVLCGFGTVVSLLQNVMFMLMPHDFQGYEAASDSEIRMTQLFLFVFFVVISTIFISSIGLLKRKNWARIILIATMFLGILLQIGGIVVNIFIFGAISSMQGPREMGTIIIIMLVMSAIVSLAMCALFGWIIKKLTSAEIRREFD